MRIFITFLLLSITFATNLFSQEKVSTVQWNGKSYLLYPYRFNPGSDTYYSYQYNIGANEGEREIVPYPGELPDGEYVMYFNPISKYKHRAWFFHRRSYYYDDTTVVAAVFHMKNNQKEGPAEFYSSSVGLVESGNYLNNQKEGVWKKKTYKYNNIDYYDESSTDNIFMGNCIEYIQYSEGIKNGKYACFFKFPDGELISFKDDSTSLTLYSRGHYELNDEKGTWLFHFRNGKLQKKFTISDSIKGSEKDEIIYSYSAKQLSYHGWYEKYFPNGQLENRILYEHGLKVQLDTGYHANGKFSFINSSRTYQEDTIEILETEYTSFDTTGQMTSYSVYKNNMRLLNRIYNSGKLYSESHDILSFSNIKNQDTLVPTYVLYDCFNSSDPSHIIEISYRHLETGAIVKRIFDYDGKDFYEEMDDFEWKSDTASHIYYLTEIDRKGWNKEIEYRTYSHYYRHPVYYQFYNNYQMVVDSIVLFKDGKRFNGKYVELAGNWRKSGGKVKATDNKIKYFAHSYGGRGFSGTPSFGYNSKKLVVFDGNYRRRGLRFRRRITNTTRGYFSNGMMQGEWLTKEKRSGHILEKNNYLNGDLNGPQYSYLLQRVTSWDSDCKKIVDKKITKKKGLLRRKRYFLESLENYQKGENHGIQYDYYCSGQLASKQTYKEGQFDGLSEFFNEDGNAVKRVNYLDGFYEGKYMEWSAIGKPRYDINYEQGVPVGEYKYYDFKGNISTIGNLQNGYKVGEWITYFTDGNIKFKDMYTIEDSTYFSLSYYNTTGARRDVDQQHLPNSGYSMQYYPSGTLAAEGRIHRNARKGIWKFYDEGSKLIRQINYEPGIIIQLNEKNQPDTLEHFGYYESWYTNGEKQTEAYVLKETSKYDCYQEVNISIQDLFYLNYWDKDKTQLIKDKTGRLKSYHLTTGKMESEGEMVDGKKTGYWRYWDPEGKLSAVGNFKNGVQEGRWLYGDLEGMHYLDDACFDMSDPRVIEDMEMKKKILVIDEIIYLKGEVIKSVKFNVNLNND